MAFCQGRPDECQPLYANTHTHTHTHTHAHTHTHTHTHTQHTHTHTHTQNYLNDTYSLLKQIYRSKPIGNTYDTSETNSDYS